eukprot:CAMPEP_0203938834 /NCGR_PEP_ID=MMETSP0359-20131031/75763_1 /ASSEMBLY_ACC=CAM_ASM_000338 /TAXON_ID=268821 /ORGANISM="Scrippsiella Hangoei, Strain SHTV-5" /LENGTH=75 /DNA_ID=CAMNT_0050869079 /DNA_START=135 /DNA_END=362 /DNA_ORIENTATION=+
MKDIANTSASQLPHASTDPSLLITTSRPLPRQAGAPLRSAARAESIPPITCLRAVGCDAGVCKRLGSQGRTRVRG